MHAAQISLSLTPWSTGYGLAVDPPDGTGNCAAHVPKLRPGFVQIIRIGVRACVRGSRHHAKTAFDEDPYFRLKRPKMRNSVDFWSAGQNLSALEPF